MTLLHSWLHAYSTGKSFIGALLAKALHDLAGESILVVCYTNHALDQFLEDLLDIGIPQTSMVRLGGKSTTRTAPISIQTLQKELSSTRQSRDWVTIDAYKETLRTTNISLARASQQFMATDISVSAILEYLEFEDPDYFDAFQVPSPIDSTGMQRVQKNNKTIAPDYLFLQWSKGQDAGILKDAPAVQTAPQIWQMTPTARQQRLSRWRDALLREQVEAIHRESTVFNDAVDNLERKFDEARGTLIHSKRIVGCTTTAAAMYRDHIKALSPGVVLVEEAGEILESHVLTSLTQDTKKLILIGDHK